MPEKEKKNIFQKRINLAYIYPEELKSYFITNLIVQSQPDHFILSFFESWPPAILGKTDEEKKMHLDSINELDAKCVSRLVVTPNKMRDIIKVLTETLNNYDKNIATKNNSLKD